MELHGARAQLGEVEPLDGAVVERDIRRLGALRGLDRGAVVLARDEDACRGALEHRVVRASMAEGGLVRAMAGREAEKLVAEADPEDGNAAERFAHDLG